MPRKSRRGGSREGVELQPCGRLHANRAGLLARTRAPGAGDWLRSYSCTSIVAHGRRGACHGVPGGGRATSGPVKRAGKRQSNARFHLWICGRRARSARKIRRDSVSLPQHCTYRTPDQRGIQASSILRDGTSAFSSMRCADPAIHQSLFVFPKCSPATAERLGSASRCAAHVQYWFNLTV